MSDNAEVQHLASRVGDLRRKLAEAEQALQAARVKATGISPGQIVVNKKGEAGRVVSVRPFSYQQKPWVDVNVRLKGGSWGKAIRCWYEDWSISSEPAGATGESV